MNNLKLKIGINATCFDERSSGAKNRFIGLYSKVFQKLNNCEFYIYQAKSIDVSLWFDSHKNINFIKTNIPSKGKWAKYLKSVLFWFKENKRVKYDIFETFHLPLLKNQSKFNILTIHDLRFLNNNFFIIKFFYYSLFKYSLQNANKIITVSNFIKHQLSFYTNKEKLIKIYNGFLPIFKKNNNTFNKKNIKTLEKKYLLSVGHFEKRKNFNNLIKAYNQNEYLKQNYDLILVGNDSGYKAKLDKLINNFNLNKKVKLLKNITDNQLDLYYRKASIFVFPSIYEGFGIPIIEAMHYNLPIAASNIEVIKEISDNQLIYFDFNNYSEINSKIEFLLKSSITQRNQINSFKKILKKYDYEYLSKQLISLYEELID